MAGEYYDIIGGVICGSFVIVGIISVLCYRPWRRWVDRERARLRVGNGPPSRGEAVLLDEDIQGVEHQVQHRSGHAGDPYTIADVSSSDQVERGHQAGKDGRVRVSAERIGSSSSRV